MELDVITVEGWLGGSGRARRECPLQKDERQVMARYRNARCILHTGAEAHTQ